MKIKNKKLVYKEALFTEVTEFDKIVEIRNNSGVLVYGSEGFVNAYRDLED